MGQLVVRNLCDDVKERLKRRAQRHGHSLEAEVRQILSDVPEIDEMPSMQWVEELKAKSLEFGVEAEDVDSLREAIAEQRRTWIDRDIGL